MWECVSAVAIGTAHIESGGVCQDRCSSRLFDQAGTTWAAVFVSDGAGSASYGELGAEMAVNAANETVSQLMQLAEIPLDESLAVQIISDIQQSIFLAAEKDNQPARSYACTFLGAISSPYGAIAFQIGDGGIVVDPGTGLELSIEPMKGLYSNMTTFITDADALKRLAVKTYPVGVKSMTLFSDGLERLALEVAENRPHRPFFEPMLRKIANLSDASRPQLSSALQSFLSSDRINERTDDDKCLAIAVLRS